MSITLQEWIDGSFTESDTDYKIAGNNILYKNEYDYLTKGIELLCDKVKPTSVLEFGFGKGWTATKFQEYGVNRHLILEANKEVYDTAIEWKKDYSSNIEIVNIFSWDYSGGESFDLLYDDREPFTSDCDDKHFAKMKQLFTNTQWYSCNADKAYGEAYDTAIDFSVNSIDYRQHLTKGFYGNY